MASLKEFLDAQRRLFIERTLVEQDFNRGKTARALGVNRATLYRLLRRYGLLCLPQLEPRVRDGNKVSPVSAKGNLNE